ncbi:MAG: PIN domain-containing protein [Bryobacteraceae bacterium]
MSGFAFFDTNVLVYADDVSSPKKRERAITLFAEHLRQGTAVVSMQVLQEYFVAATRKLRLAPDAAQRKVEIVARAKVVRLGVNDVIAAIELHRLTQVSFWDALIVHAARSVGAVVLYSEDLQHGGVQGGVRVVNPFAP